LSHLVRAARRLVLVVPLVLVLAPASAHAAAELAIVPDEVDFGAHPAGGSADRTVTIRNLGPDAAALSDIFLAGPGIDQFDFAYAASDTCEPDVPLAPTAECQITLRFSTAPGTTGAFEAFLGVEGGPDDLPAVARLTGSVVGPPQVVVDPQALHFSSTPVGTVSPAQQFLVRNVGAGAATGLGVSGGNASFNVSNGCPAVLAPGAECAVSVAFAPKALSPRNNNSAYLSVSWAGSPGHRLHLVGAAVNPPDPYATTSRDLGDLADFVPKLLRGGPLRTQLPAFRAPATGTLKLRVLTWTRKGRVLVAQGSQDFSTGAEYGLRVRSTKQGRKLLRRPQRTRIKVVFSYTDLASGRVIRQAPEYRVKAPKVKRLGKTTPKKRR
jgi:hypothetical protein